MSQTFLLRDLREGARRHLSELIASSLGGGTIGLHDEIDFDQAAELLAVAFLPLMRTDEEGAPSLKLTSFEFRRGEDVVRATPEDALQHPSIGRWIAPSWIDFIAKQLRAGATLECLQPEAPEAASAEVRDQDGDIAVRVVLHWPGGTAYVGYGCPARYGIVVCATSVPCIQLSVLGSELAAISLARDAAGVSSGGPHDDHRRSLSPAGGRAHTVH
jgi:hypothetical protein